MIHYDVRLASWTSLKQISLERTQLRDKTWGSHGVSTSCKIAHQRLSTLSLVQLFLFVPKRETSFWRELRGRRLIRTFICVLTLFRPRHFIQPSTIKGTICEGCSFLLLLSLFPIFTTSLKEWAVASEPPKFVRFNETLMGSLVKTSSCKVGGSLYSAANPVSLSPMKCLELSTGFTLRKVSLNCRWP